MLLQIRITDIIEIQSQNGFKIFFYGIADNIHWDFLVQFLLHRCHRHTLQATGLNRSPNRRTRHHDLDELAGTWSAEEAAEFDEALAAQRRIDPGVWR